MNDRNDGLRRQSDSFLLDAQRQDQGVSTAEKLHWSFQAGYLALLSAFDADEAQAFVDHPSARAALEGAKRLGLESRDRVFAERAALDYYSGALPTDAGDE